MFNDVVLILDPPLFLSDIIIMLIMFFVCFFQFWFWDKFSDHVRGYPLENDEKPIESASPCKAVAVPALQDEANLKLRIAWLAFSMNRNNLFTIFIYSLYFLLIFLVI